MEELKIVLIDNFDWTNGDKSDFFYVIPTFDFSKADVFEFLNDSSFKENNIVFLINVHCVYQVKDDKKSLYQDQFGVDIYRELVKIYEKEERKLKVAFFSPVSLDKLISFKKENYILEIHPFYKCPFNLDTVVKELRAKTDWKIFNTASENLLAGYSLQNKEKIDLGKKKILFIDDQKDEWETTLSKIFGENIIYTKVESTNYQENFREKLDNGGIFSNMKETIEKNNDIIILSDFYLKENHEPGNWMNDERLKEISGFKLFQKVRNEILKGKAVPYIMHTSSNKIPYYKFFDQNGIDDWIVKDVRSDANEKDKKEYYAVFKKSIEDIAKQSIYNDMITLWESIQRINKLEESKWWFSPKFDENDFIEFITARGETVEFRPVNLKREYNNKTKDDVVQILKSSWYALRRYINREILYEKNNSSEEEKFLATSLCNNFGKVLELFNIKSGIKFSSLTAFILLIRNSASHIKDYQYFRLKDAIILFKYLLFCLEEYNTYEELKIDYQPNFIVNTSYYRNRNNRNIEIEYECSIFWIYIQFYNLISSDKKGLKPLIAKRIDELFDILKDNKHIVQLVYNERRLNDIFEGSYSEEIEIFLRQNKKIIKIRFS